MSPLSIEELNKLRNSSSWDQTFPKINIKAEWIEVYSGIQCTSYLTILRVELEDDGSLTVVTDGSLIMANQWTLRSSET